MNLIEQIDEKKWVVSDTHFGHDAILKEGGMAMKSQKARQASLNKEYASLEKVKVYIKKHGIKSQPDWNAHAKANRDELKKLKIPSNLRNVYNHSGRKLWKGWGYYLIN